MREREVNKIKASAVAFATSFCLIGTASAAELRGTVVGIADGDTITVLDGEKKQHKIRLAGIDAPEKHQGFAERSKQNLSNIAFKKQATLDCYKTDQYKRKVCRVHVDGNDIALAQVRAGLAWHYKYFEKEQTATERAAYTRAEDEARASRVGLWQSDRPVPPWEFRRTK
jgi:endonuclease YncB( thermonuclease family)